MYQGQLGIRLRVAVCRRRLELGERRCVAVELLRLEHRLHHAANCFINVNSQYFDPNTVLRATLSNDLAGELVARYKLDPAPVTLYGGWIYARQMNPSDDFLGGFPSIAQGIFVPPGAFNKSGVYTNSAITANNFDIQKVLNTFWFGARWKPTGVS